MDSNWRFSILPRLILIALTFFLSGIFFQETKIIFGVIFLAASIIQVKLLIEYQERTNQNLSVFLKTLRFDEFNVTSKADVNDPSVQQLENELNEALKKIKNARREKDSESLFFKNIVMHVGIGLLAFKEDGKIEIFNSAARKLLKVKHANDLTELKEAGEPLVQIFRKLKTGGRELIRHKIGEDMVQLSVYAIELTLRGEAVKLISIQNIQSELEEKEMEAWQNLVRVLTHEIMNSVTPISSLAGIVEEELKHYLEQQNDLPLTKEQLQDIHLSLQTISKRSDGLIHFVKEFRSLTNIPKPRPTQFDVKSLLEEICMLHKKELGDKGIDLNITIYPDDLTVLADKSLVEQVVINLLKNAIQAFDDDQISKVIELKGALNEKSRPVIIIKDNGVGIDSEALDKIFIPFFTTKKAGSGIGLSLSRQIMRQHQGTLTVKSTPGKGTEFFMRF